MALKPKGRLLIKGENPQIDRMWSLDDNGDKPPKWARNGDQTTLRKPFAIVLDPEPKEIYVTDMRLNGVMAFSVPEVFQPVAR